MSRAQIECGQLKQVAGENSSVKYAGMVRLIGRLDGLLELVPHPRCDADNDRTPDYEVFYQPRATDGKFPIGAAWLKNSENVDGGDFLSFTLVHPDWQDDLSLAAWPAENVKKDGFRIVWSRPRAAQERKAA